MRKFLLLFIWLFALSEGQAQSNATIAGKVTTSQGQPVELLTVALEGTVLGTNTNAAGEFILNNIKPGSYTLRVGGIGYKSLRQPITLGSGDNLNLQLTIQASTSTLDEVVVSASRSVETLDETPASVHVIDSRTLQIQSQISTDISNILANSVPGLAFNSNTTSNVGQTLRGRNALVMVDGIPQSTPLRNGSRDIRTIDPTAIERVEVVKGATAVYGNGADGGLINYITKQANTSQPFSAYTSVTGTGNLFHADGTLGGRISQQFTGKLNNFDYVASGTYEKTGVLRDGEGEVISPVYGLGETKMYNGFAKAGYNFNSNHRLEGMYNYFGSRQNSDYILQEGIYGEKPSIGVRGEVQGEPEGTKYNHNAQLRYIGKNLFLNTNLELSSYLQSFYTVYGYTPYFEGGGQSTIKSAKRGVRLNLNTPFRISSGIEGSVVYGADYLNDVTSQPLVDGRTWVPEMDLHNLAPYAQLQLNILQDLNFKAGYRFDNVSVNVDDFQQLVLASGAGGDFVQGAKLKFNANTFNLGLRYSGLEYFKPFVSYSQGFSMIDVGRYVRSATEDFIAQMDLEPVIVNNYEAGFHSQFGIASFSGAYFISTSKLGANLIANEAGVYEIERAPERVEGFEALVDLFLSDKITLGVNASYSEGKADINNNEKYSDSEDKYLTSLRIPPFKFTSYLNLKPIQNLSVNLQWIYSGERDRFDRNAKGGYNSGEGPVKAFDVFNLAASYQATEKLSLNVGVENLLDKAYYLPQAYWYGRNDNFTRANGARFQLGAAYKW
ncbi:iron complex outermembrane receptor protein [Pontibacter mucosus]|uniref:Iron complex outermembrane receptor protein n=1 Tax=Pontibacter mucosus TaxID=1649266 RepID=A0A2T5YJD6_9BACT|nr:TonB-dependent receptor [Pontibacter mucosus]PTX19424.1 iron complex outermembrane receptor protein [Pontibacter mucosus]